MKLSKVVIHKFKCFESDQEFAVEDGISILVGLNESGKTSALEAMAKTNYFEDDPAFKFSTTHDYPRIEKKRMEKSGVNPKAESNRVRSCSVHSCRVPDEYLVHARRPLLMGREVLKATLAHWSEIREC